jgi:N-acetylneuraminic acid mutarotase
MPNFLSQLIRQSIFSEGNLIIFGGIFGITTSNWNKDIKAYNLFSKKWKTIGRLLIERRHFEVAQDGSKFYLVGGTTKFRLPTSTMEVFDFKDGMQKIAIFLTLSIVKLFFRDCQSL